ncbi:MULTISPECIES: hypothetical protein [unclassified Chelatococcus]|uniref:hypothetical protein n=1 Tax=unclassified Chelatococcus TaxID=2638111 RepID=UPI0002EF1560|nr:MULTISPECIES: hypothetical protein [unclassified Chelatococcus]ALA16115.1 phosphohydrolase [Chelatococcus sp. CO-6]
MDTRKGDWMQTYTGRQFWPLDPRPDDVDIDDIAHALGNLCRYNGHCRAFYSVAEHSVLVAERASPPNKLAALLHDAAEAYLCDLPRPVKRSVSGYAEAEEAVERAIAAKFGVPHPWPAEVKDLDNRILHDEKAQLMRPEPAPWRLPGEPLGVTLHLWRPKAAAAHFKLMFYRLVNGAPQSWLA